MELKLFKIVNDSQKLKGIDIFDSLNKIFISIKQ